MPQQVCDIFYRRPATVRVTVLENGQRKLLDVCDYDYDQLTRHQRYISPLESLFRGGLFDDFFGDRFRLQLEQVRRAAEGQGIRLEFDDSLIRYLADEGYQPEFGARELRRQIRQRVETKLAAEMLKGNIKEGDSVTLRYDAADDTVAIAEPVSVQ